MLEDRSKWNRKYARASYPTNPSAIVRKHYKLARPGRALDIAAGNGRNALFLANHGYSVDALDISEIGLKCFAGLSDAVNAVCVDLDHYDLPSDRYSLVINIKYLNRRLFPQIYRALAAGGVLIFQTFLRNAKPIRRTPCRREHLLRPNELIRAFPQMRVAFYTEDRVPENDDPYPLASLVAVKG